MKTIKRRILSLAVAALLCLSVPLSFPTLFSGHISATAAAAATRTARTIATTTGGNGETLLDLDELAPINERIGVTHSSSLYTFDSSVSSLEEGARYVHEMGARTIKLWLTNTVTTAYALNADWSRYNLSDMVAILETEYYQNVLNMDFDTIIFEAHEFDTTRALPDWKDGLHEDEEQQITEDLMYDLTYYLMTRFNGTGKHFILQNWEGDNMLMGNKIYVDNLGNYHDEMFPLLTAQNPTGFTQAEINQKVKNKIAGITHWFQARQRGVERARNELLGQGISNVWVDNMAEINFVILPLETDASGYAHLDAKTHSYIYANKGVGNIFLLDSVLPYVDADLFSFSSWFTHYISAESYVPDPAGITDPIQFSGVQSFYHRLQRMKSMIGSTYRDGTMLEPKGDAKPRKYSEPRLAMGEFGKPEGEANDSGSFGYQYLDDAFQRQIVVAQVEAAIEMEFEYAVYWNMICNERNFNSDVQFDITIGEMAETNDQVRGFHLIRPDGTFTGAYYSLKSLMEPNDITADDSDTLELLHRDLDTLPGGGSSKVFQFEEDVSFVEVAVLLDRQNKSTNHLSNNKAYRSQFDQKIKLEYSNNGTTWFTDSQQLAVYVYSKAGKDFILFTNKNYELVPNGRTSSIAAKARYFRITENLGGDAIDYAYIKAYKHEGRQLYKLGLATTIDGEEYTQTQFNVGFNETLTIEPQIIPAIDGFDGTVEYSSSNRFVAAILSQDDGVGVIRTRTPGAVIVTVTVAGGGLERPISRQVRISVQEVGDELIVDDLNNYRTIGYVPDPGKEDMLMPDGEHGDSNRNNEKRENFGGIVYFGEQLWVESWNIDYAYGNSNTWFREYADGNIAQILDWNTYNSGHIIYEAPADEVFGGYRLTFLNYENPVGTLDRCNVYVSSDYTNWQRITSQIDSSELAQQSWYLVDLVPRQVIPSDTKYIKIEIKYNDVNRWNPCLTNVALYGEAPVPEEFVDSNAPTIDIDGTYAESYTLNSTIDIHNAEFSDDYYFADLEDYYDDHSQLYVRPDELETSVRVFAIMDNGARIELTGEVSQGKLLLSMRAEYMVQYRCIDLGGNETVIEKRFNVVADSGDGGGGCKGCKSGNASMLFAALAVVAVVVGGKRAFLK